MMKARVSVSLSLIVNWMLLEIYSSYMAVPLREYFLQNQRFKFYPLFGWWDDGLESLFYTFEFHLEPVRYVGSI